MSLNISTEQKFKIGEQKILNLLHKETQEHGLNYIIDYGYREFFPDGRSFGICTNSIWKIRKQNQDYEKLISEFYAKELLKVKRNNYNCSVRVQGQSYNQFLEEIGKYDLGNVLVLYKFLHDRICGYYFLAEGKNNNASSDFYNSYLVFEEIVQRVKKQIIKTSDQYSMLDKATHLFPKHVIEELLPSINRKSKRLYDPSSNSVFSLRQTEILTLIANNYIKNKAISGKLDITVRTVEWHIGEIKAKANLLSRRDLIEFAKKIIKF